MNHPDPKQIIEYVELLIESHRLIKEGKHNTKEFGDNVRKMADILFSFHPETLKSLKEDFSRISKSLESLYEID